MFYSDFVLSKKGPLARIWLAAHWDKKLTKAQIFETNIESSIERILRPKVKLALRTSGHLMLGVVRIYSRKTKYLLADCNEAFVKIKMAFRPGMVDLPDDHREAAVNAVTLPEVFHDFDSVMPDLNNMDIEVQFTLNQSRADEITMREDYGTVLPLHSEDAFDLAFDATGSDVLRHSVTFDQSLQQANLLFGEGIDAIERNKSTDVGSALGHISMDVDLPKDDGFGSMTGGGLFEGGLFEDTPMPSVSNIDNNALPISEAMGTDMQVVPSTSKEPVSRLNEDDDFDDNFGAPSPGGGSSIGSRPQSPLQGMSNEIANISDFKGSNSTSDNQNNIPNEFTNQQGMLSQETSNDHEANAMKEIDTNEGNENIDQTTLLQNEEESFALAPVNASSLVGLSKSRRKRKLIVDEVKNISGEEMKGQLSDTTDIVTTLDLAPPTKRLMRWKETGGVEKLFALPGKIIPSGALFKNYQRHLVSISAPNEDAKNDVDNATDTVFAAPALPVTVKRGRKRKRPANEEEPPQEIPINREQNVSQFQFNNDESTNSVIPNVNAENDTSQWSVADQNKEREMNHGPDVSMPESYVAQYNAIENSNVGGGMTPWHITDYQNPPSVRSSQGGSLGTSDNPAAVPYDMNSNNSTPWINTEYQTNTFEPNQNTDGFSVQNDNVSAITHNEGNVPKDRITTSWHETDYNVDKTMNTYPSNDDNIQPPMTPGINADNLATPWHDVDYFNPMSVEPVEERGADETVEQFEERILNKRAGHLYSTIRIRISTGTMTTFNDLTMGNVKKQVAQKFYSLLVLKKHKVLELTQEAPYDEILLSKGANFDDPKL